MLECYSKLELILFKKKVLEQLKNYLLMYENGNPTLVNTRPFPVGYSGTDKCQACGNTTQYYAFLQPGETQYLLCTACKSHARILKDDIKILTRRPR